MKLEKLEKTVAIKEGVSVQKEGTAITVKGPKGEISRDFPSKRISVEVKGSEILISSKNVTKREKTLMGTYQAHLRNMVQGVEEPFVYKLKVCSSHFPMNVSVNNGKLVVKNFIGEAVPREMSLPQGADVKVEGDEIVIESPDKEIAGRIASNAEQLTRRTAFDRRIFQDGIYITQKGKKQITL
ncbi:MAG: 50S ribosomal protein L6 [Nanoarchaeota archaeon]